MQRLEHQNKEAAAREAEEAERLRHQEAIYRKELQVILLLYPCHAKSSFEKLTAHL